MKSKILIIFFVIFYNSVAIAENLKIQAKNITLDKNDENSIFENDVIIQTFEGNRIFSDYAEYNKKKQFIILKQNISVEDVKGNKINAELADYDEKSKTFKTSGKTKITTSDEYVIEGEDIILNDVAQSIKSEKNTIITDEKITGYLYKTLNIIPKIIFLGQLEKYQLKIKKITLTNFLKFI